MSIEKKITVYSKPNCVQCTATYRQLDKLQVAYEVVDVSQDADALQMILNLGHKQVPVVVTGDDNWAGFRPDKLNALAQ